MSDTKITIKTIEGDKLSFDECVDLLNTFNKLTKLVDLIDCGKDKWDNAKCVLCPMNLIENDSEKQFDCNFDNICATVVLVNNNRLEISRCIEYYNRDNEYKGTYSVEV